MLQHIRPYVAAERGQTFEIVGNNSNAGKVTSLICGASVLVGYIYTKQVGLMKYQTLEKSADSATLKAGVVLVVIDAVTVVT